MKLKQSLIKTFTESLDHQYGCIYDGKKTRIYDCDHNKVIVVTKEYPKCKYYYDALNFGYDHIPKIYDLIVDHNHGIYIIKREKLYPITDGRKLVRLEIVKNALEHNAMIQDKIASETLRFHRRNNIFKLDFSPHCFMETKNKKIVVSDLFME